MTQSHAVTGLRAKFHLVSEAGSAHREIQSTNHETFEAKDKQIRTRRNGIAPFGYALMQSSRTESERHDNKK